MEINFGMYGVPLITNRAPCLLYTQYVFWAYNYSPYKFNSLPHGSEFREQD